MLLINFAHHIGLLCKEVLIPLLLIYAYLTEENPLAKLRICLAQTQDDDMHVVVVCHCEIPCDPDNQNLLSHTLQIPAISPFHIEFGAAKKKYY